MSIVNSYGNVSLFYKLVIHAIGSIFFYFDYFLLTVAFYISIYLQISIFSIGCQFLSRKKAVEKI